MTSRSQDIRFPTANGETGVELAARLDLPPGEPAAFALFAHCFTCSKDLKSVRRLSQALVDRRIAVLRFDFTGLGESEGEFADTNFSSNLDDLVAAADFLRREYRAPQILVGHSLGGAAVLAAAHRIPESVAVATIAAPSDPAHLRTSVLQGADQADGPVEVSIAGRSFTVKPQLFEDLEQQQLLAGLGRLRRALLVMHSPVDNVVGIDHARRIFEAARHPKSFVALDGADHLLLEREPDARFAGEILACWAYRYVTRAAQEPAPLAAGEVEVRGRRGFAQLVRTERHELAADEPLSVPGATDTGPNPYELLLAGLGACISMTLRMYADRKGWPLAGTVVRLRHHKVHARDCGECETREGKIDVIDKFLELEGELDPEQRARLLEIAEKCPVHRTLTSETRIRKLDAWTS